MWAGVDRGDGFPSVGYPPGVTNRHLPPDDPLISRAPGTYLLLLYLAESARLRVGRLGPVDAPAGWYIYVGSALGGLGPRLGRHARRDKPRHWHIDTLRETSVLVAIAVRPGPNRVECETAETVASLAGASRPVRGFGSSDCRCRAHLFHLPDRPELRFDPTWQAVSVAEDAHGRAELVGSGDAAAPGPPLPGPLSPGPPVLTPLPAGPVAPGPLVPGTPASGVSPTGTST